MQLALFSEIELTNCSYVTHQALLLEAYSYSYGSEAFNFWFDLCSKQRLY